MESVKAHKPKKKKTQLFQQYQYMTQWVERAELKSKTTWRKKRMHRTNINSSHGTVYPETKHTRGNRSDESAELSFYCENYIFSILSIPIVIHILTYSLTFTSTSLSKCLSVSSFLFTTSFLSWFLTHCPRMQPLFI